MILLFAAALGYVAAGQVDSDGDGLTDRVEERGWNTLDGRTFVTDPGQADTDGDGLTDREEAGPVASGSGADAIYSGASDPLKIDSDDDGLDDTVETTVWLSTGRASFKTDPWRSDTDGDGLTDGDEAGASVGGPDTGIEFAIYSDPLVPDSDADGLSDAAEADLSLDAFDPDTDGDAVDDAGEVERFGTSPDVADTDGDGFDDAYEIRNRESQGLDPLWADEKVDPSAYAWEFAQGAVLGEVVPGDSLAWLAGNLASGGASFIPGVGWVVGGAADLRDAVGSAIHADWVGAGFGLVGLLPATGDALAIPAKAGKFVLRHPELAPMVGASIAALGWVPTHIKVATSERITENWGFLRDAHFSEKSLLRLQEGRVGLDKLAQAMKREGHVAWPGPRARFFATGLEGEVFLARLFPANPGEYTQVVRSTSDCAEVCNAVARRFDVLVDNVAHESKVGRVNLSDSIKRQIESDAYLVESGVIEGAHWHFFASSRSNTMGPSTPVLDLLDERGITYTIHVPA